MAQKTKAQKATVTKKPSKTTSQTAAKSAAAKKPASKTSAAKAAKTATSSKGVKATKSSVASRSASVKSKAATKPAAKTKAAPAKAAKPSAKTPVAAKPAAKKPAAKAPAARKAAAPASGATRRAASGKTAPASRAAPKAAKAAAAKTAGGKPRRAVAAAVTPSANAKISAPVTGTKPAKPRPITGKAAETREAAQVAKKPVNQRHGFRTGEFVVYPAHGVGQIVGIEEQEIAGMALELFVITFDKEKLTLRVPTGKLESVGMRKLSDEASVKKAMDTLKGRARVKRTMWSRRAQEYVAKITSGDLMQIAEVVRDLYRSEAQPEQSYSERQLYEDALDRMARELAAVEKLDDRGAVQRIVEVLSKSAKGRRLAEEEANEAAAAANENDETQAA